MSVPLADRRHAEYDVLLAPLVLRDELRTLCSLRLPSTAVFVVGVPGRRETAHLSNNAVPVKVAGDGKDNVLRAVPALPIPSHLGNRKRLNRLGLTEGRAAQSL